MAEALKLVCEPKACFNCACYGWEQPVENNSIQQCAKCKMVMYCSRQCQKEHWEKVHKYHCRFIAKLKVLPKSVHHQATCSDCKEEANISQLEMCKPDNPVLGCPMAIVDMNFGFGPPVPLGEMTGKFITKAEATVALMLRILLKMKNIKHTAWVNNTKLSDELFSTLVKARGNCWLRAYMLTKTGPNLVKAVGFAVGIPEIENLIEINDKLLALVKFKEDNEFRPWETLKILASLLLTIPLEQDGNEGLPGISEDILKIRVPASQFNSLWEQILETLSGRLVPFLTLVEVLCGGQLTQKCYGCMEDCAVKDLDMIGRVDHDLEVRLGQGPVLLFGSVKAVICGSPHCLKQCKAKIYKYDLDLVNLYVKIVYERSLSRCDFCGLAGTSGSSAHRCSRCLTKVYCGEECRDQDWVVHKEVCREGEVERKKKGGQLARKKEGRERARNFFTKTEK